MDGDDLALLQAARRTSRPSGSIADAALLDQFDQFRRRVDNAAIGGMDEVYRRAFDVLTSDKVARALDVTHEDPAAARPLRHRLADAPGRRRPDVERPAPDRPATGRSRRTLRDGRLRLLGHARRQLPPLRKHLPLFDQGISALVEDIYARGLDHDVTVVVWGEFGRTPKINKDAGRDHWARVNSALLAGGGMKSAR